MHSLIPFFYLATTSFTAAHVSFSLTERSIGQSCSISGESGTCQYTSDCTTQGYNEPGHCPGAADIQCCVKKPCSTDSGPGTCMNTANTCAGSFIAGACPGDSTVQCCVKSSSPTPPSGGGSGASLVAAAESWVPKHIPYVYGGGGCAGPSANRPLSGNDLVGFDCSGLTQYAACKSGHGTIPRTAQAQYHSAMGKHLPRAQAEAGDMLFWGDGGDCVSRVAHVGIFVRAGVMVNAARTGTDVKEEDIWTSDAGSGESACADAVRFW